MADVPTQTGAQTGASTISTGVSVVPVILSGGAGSRLWPLSTDVRPKQFHVIAGATSLLRQTLDRVMRPGPASFEAAIVVCAERHRDLTLRELAAAGATGATLILEPVPRNTAPALAAAALVQAERDPDALMLALPADHVIGRPEALSQACVAAAAAARAGRIVVFSITPTSPETGYGYIRLGAPLDGSVREVDAFREKPDRATAEAYVASGRHGWNAGIFFFRAGALIDEMAVHAPEALEAARAAVAAARRIEGHVALDPEAFARAPSISIDYAVMERTRRAAVRPVDMEWSDVGSFDAIWELAERDASGNALSGPVHAVETRNCLIRAGKIPVAVIGVDDLVVVATEDGVIVTPRARAQEVKIAVDAFKG